jgi:hypothetical protein
MWFTVVLWPHCLAALGIGFPSRAKVVLSGTPAMSRVHSIIHHLLSDLPVNVSVVIERFFIGFGVLMIVGFIGVVIRVIVIVVIIIVVVGDGSSVMPGKCKITVRIAASG